MHQNGTPGPRRRLRLLRREARRLRGLALGLLALDLTLGVALLLQSTLARFPD